MQTKCVNETYHVCGQLSLEQLTQAQQQGFLSVICMRPDGEGGADQPTHLSLKAHAESLGLTLVYMPVEKGQITDLNADKLRQQLSELPKPVLAFCASGNRAHALHVLAESATSVDTVRRYDVVVVGGGAGGIGITASLLKRQPDLSIAIIEPSEFHYYQPAWTLVGGGAFDVQKTQRKTVDLIPPGAEWIRAAVSCFEPDTQAVILSHGEQIQYQFLIVATGLEIAWDRIEGLEDALGSNGVTSNYRFDLAPYTWELVQGLKQGNAIFTQPPMPIKCAGAPQKAMYLSCDHWLKQGVLNHINVELNNAGAVLFGVAEFVPPLMAYVKKYNAKLAFQSNLVKVDGPAKTAWFDVTDSDGQVTRVKKSFDVLHVVPPQRSPDVVRNSPLADAQGWCEVNQFTLQHVRYDNVFSLGDVCSSPNAKTAAAVRKQIVVVAENLLACKASQEMPTRYDGYGSCPLTVEKGKVVLAEFGFGGKLLPTFPLDPTVPRRSAWFLKSVMLPSIYWHAMLKGHEWLARPAASKEA
ncbi:MAG: sulfur transferase domain-containing protein [Moraxellaceae bacterium]|nr:sulfur transferase domain-containing protein [Moraxellaceae bacterium]MDZ4299270.1 sulfur transferase domain-containing protein [Moraxellaceae bacterium]MDZ4385890.1 sulfur transferase domain-containing protein [Moraxellaceae bacterium]